MVLSLFFSASLSAGNLDAKRADAEVVLRKIMRDHESFISDPLLKQGKVGEFLKRPEFENLSKEDAAAMRASIIAGDFTKKTAYEIDGSKLHIKEPMITKAAGTAVVLDFIDLDAKDAPVLYINNKKYELKYLVSKEDGRTGIMKQFRDFKKFWGIKELQAFLPALSNTQIAWAKGFLDILMAPLAMTGCKYDEEQKKYTGFGSAIANNLCFGPHAADCSNNKNKFKGLRDRAHERGRPNYRDNRAFNPNQ